MWLTLSVLPIACSANRKPTILRGVYSSYRRLQIGREGQSIWLGKPLALAYLARMAFVLLILAVNAVPTKYQLTTVVQPDAARG